MIHDHKVFSNLPDLYHERETPLDKVDSIRKDNPPYTERELRILERLHTLKDSKVNPFYRYIIDECIDVIKQVESEIRCKTCEYFEVGFRKVCRRRKAHCGQKTLTTENEDCSRWKQKVQST